MNTRRLFCIFSSNERGGAAIEFAILAPVFFLMMFGMIAYAIYFGAAHSVQQLAADAARTSIAGLDESERNTLVGNFLDNNAGEYILIDPSQMSFVIGDKPGDTSQYRVTITYDASSLPIWDLSVPLPLPNRVITYTSTIRKGGV
jgi:Flp pilus assembly protein TadG